MQTWIAEQTPLQITECPIESAFLEKAPNLGTLHALSRRMSILNQHPVKFRDKTFHSPDSFMLTEQHQHAIPTWN